MQKLDRLLLNRHVERFRAAAGILSAGVLLWGLVAGVNLLALIGVVLLAATVVLLAWPKFRKSEGDDLLILLRRHANQLAWNLEHFWNWWEAIHNPDFKGKLSDGYGPTTHQKANEKLLFKFGQFFSAAWSYQSFWPDHRHATKVKALVDEIYLVLGKAGDPADLTDARIDSDELHSVGRLSTERWGSLRPEPYEEVDFKAVLKQHAGEFEALKVFLGEAGPNTSARRRLDEAAKVARTVEEWLKKNRYGP